jgi:mono/diheme cytochrome c family protein/predicted  nucleic acid-binding Zn-ribbon protein
MPADPEKKKAEAKPPAEDAENEEVALLIRENDPLESQSHARLFFLASLLLLAGTGWSVWDELYGRRPWKRHQAEFIDKATAELGQQRARIHAELQKSDGYAEIRSELEKIEGELADSSAVKEALAERQEIEARLAAFRKEFMEIRGRYQAAVYRMETTEDGSTRERLLEEIQELERAEDGVSLAMERLAERERELATTLREAEERRKRLQDQLTALEAPLKILERRLKGIRLRKIQIDQYVNSELKLIDRCQSCHPAIVSAGFSHFEHPYRTHPAVIGSDPSGEDQGVGRLLSLHPVEKYGCTPCHRGQGYATTAPVKAHGEVEYWETPILTGATVQASCLKCHAQEPYLEAATQLNEGRRLIKRLGCYGCHNFGDYLTREETWRRNGPDLAGIRRKVNPSWLVDWIEKPQALRPDTLMPDFRFSRQQALAIASYLWQNGNSTPELPQAPPTEEGDVEAGKVLFETRGCLGCHRVGEKGQTAARELSRVGEKMDYTYLAHWILEPQALQPRSEMPKLELVPKEGAQIAAYLITLRTEERGDDAPDLTDPETRRMGQTLITMYNCHGCHAIPGFEDSEPLVPDIDTLGSNPIERFDFGLLEEEVLASAGLRSPRENVGKARELWIRKKLEDPRAFDEGKHKRDFERLRMPDFHLTSEQIDALTTVLLGLTSEHVPEDYRRQPRDIQRAAARGRILYETYRCAACHGEGGVGGVENPNYAKGTVPALDKAAEVMMLYDEEDTEAVMREIVRGIPLDSLLDDPPVRRFGAVVAKYHLLRDTILNGNSAGRADPEGPDPPYHMPSWDEIFDSRQVDDLLVYLLSEYPWDES